MKVKERNVNIDKQTRLVKFYTRKTIVAFLHFVMNYDMRLSAYVTCPLGISGFHRQKPVVANTSKGSIQIGNRTDVGCTGQELQGHSHSAQPMQCAERWSQDTGDLRTIVNDQE